MKAYKPKLRMESGKWTCTTGGSLVGSGLTVREAYTAWNRAFWQFMINDRITIPYRDVFGIGSDPKTEKH
jgi:hypothetical protein